MKKIVFFLVMETMFVSVSPGQNKPVTFKTIGREYKLPDKIGNRNRITQNYRLLKSQQNMMPDSAVFTSTEEDTIIHGYIRFKFLDTLRSEEYYLKNDTGSSVFMKEEYHFEDPDQSKGYYIDYYANDEGILVPSYKEDILSGNCEVGGFRDCGYWTGKTYEWNSDRSDWRGVSSSTIDKYNSQGKIIESADFKWDDDLYDWVYTYLGTWEYNANNKVTQQIIYHWNEDLDTIVPYEKEIFDYDANDSIILDCYLTWDSTWINWDTISRREYSYDVNNIYQNYYQLNNETNNLELWNYLREENIYNAGLLIRKNHYSRKSLSDSWILYRYDEYEYTISNKLSKVFSEWYSFESQSIYNYDASNQIILEAYYKKHAGDEDWVLDNEHKYNYDSKGNLLEEQQYHKNDDEQHGDGWKEINEYDDYGNKTLCTQYELIFPDSTFRFTWKYEDFRNSTGLLIKEAEYKWDTITNDWVNQYGMNEYFYNNGLLVKSRYAEWDTSMSNWRPSYEEVFYYKDANNITDIRVDSVLAMNSGDLYTIRIFGSGGAEDYSYSIDDQENWSSSNTFSDLQQGTYYIFIRDGSGVISAYPNNPVILETTAVNLNQFQTIHVYPNPFTDILNIRLDERIQSISIYNNKGNLVFTQKGSGTEQHVSPGNLQSGIYIIYISTKENLHIQKIIKH